jgi:hypothetical protein
MKVAGQCMKETRLLCNTILRPTILTDRSGLVTTHQALARSMQERCHLDFPAQVVSTWVAVLALVDHL